MGTRTNIGKAIKICLQQLQRHRVKEKSIPDTLKRVRLPGCGRVQR